MAPAAIKTAIAATAMTCFILLFFLVQNRRLPIIKAFLSQKRFDDDNRDLAFVMRNCGQTLLPPM
jgi:hypothetical protein